MNTVGAAASCVATHTHTHIYIYIMVCYTYPVYRYSVCISVKSNFVTTTKSTVEIYIYITCCTKSPQNISHTVQWFLKPSCFQLWWFKRGSTWTCCNVTCLLVGWSLISVQLSSVCIQFCCGCTALTCTPVAAGLYCTTLYYNLPLIKEYCITDM